MARWLRTAVAAAVGAGAVHVTGDDFLHGARRHTTLDGRVGATDAWTRSVAPGAREATGELCDADLPCTEAVRADTLTLYRFAERGDAVAAARGPAGEAYLSGWIVVRFDPGELTPEQRREVALRFDCTNVGIAEDGYEC